jgi:hypothetical protein
MNCGAAMIVTFIVPVSTMQYDREKSRFIMDTKQIIEDIPTYLIDTQITGGKAIKIICD